MPPPSDDTKPKFADGDSVTTVGSVKVNAGLLEFAPPMFVTLLQGTLWTVTAVRAAKTPSGKPVWEYRIRAGQYTAWRRESCLRRKNKDKGALSPN